MRLKTHIGFILFLLIYSYMKYTAMPNLMGSMQYLLTTVLVVLLTAIIPYIVSFILTRKGSSLKQYMTAAFLPLLLCTTGLAVYFYLFIAPNAPGMVVTQVLPRAIVPGLVMGAILILPMFMHKKTSLSVS